MSDNSEQILYILRISLCSIIIVAIIFCIVLYVLIKKVRSFPLELHLYFLIYEMIIKIFLLLPTIKEDNSVLCYLQSFSNIVFPLSSVIIIVCTSIIAFLSIKIENYYIYNKNLIRIYAIVSSLLFPIIFGIM